ncbi:L-lactate dehydrogenase [Ligilactobacillus cholophilus]|uniref:L-lactate dehydrogenase n=1 Tax=Ligilactobacillus cholophilus TaxID=3050131 RepID=UPI0025B268B9|nr:L-lactate dehydrogenase [Ligilactobacillus cholophilus]
MATLTARKAAIVGVGGVGMGCAYSILNQGLLDEMVLIDVAGDKADGEARDLMDGVSYAPENCKVYHGDYSDCKDAQMVIITAGINQKPGQSRLELVGTNAKIMRSIVKEVMASGFDGNLVIVSNPVDVLTYVAWEESGLPQNRVIGTGTSLDSTRLRMQLANKTGVDPHAISAYIVGEHGDSEQPLWSQASIGGKPLMDWIEDGDEGVIKKEDLEEIRKTVRDAAYYIIDRKQITNWGIGLSTARVVRAILNDERAILPVSAYFNGEYGLNDIFTGIPTIVGENGVERIVEMHITDEEKAGLHKSASELKEVLDSVRGK